ncbi:AAA family ATPase [Deferribacter autotrophicus]|uniref:AAA family ATPase n=1 Tax=Deferribacter autotrophicus TaxID=500465 RepID=A0A5A8F1U6_9BACT|nr:ATP-binding protein [Deferribacter autotrophicus]KAA0257285.1 AAA family ATPase [Deferribacter autotrophicus]
MAQLIMKILKVYNDEKILGKLNSSTELTKVLQDYFHINNDEANLLGFLIAKTIDDIKGVDIKHFCDKINMPKKEYLSLLKLIIALEDKTFITTKPNELHIFDTQETILNPKIKVEATVLKKLISEEPIISSEKLKDNNTVLEALTNPLKERISGNISASLLLSSINDIMQKIDRSLYIYQLLSKYSQEEQIFFLYILSTHFEAYHYPEPMIENFAEIMNFSIHKKLKFLYAILKKELPIVRDSIIQIDSEYPYLNPFDVKFKINELVITKLLSQKDMLFLSDIITFKSKEIIIENVFFNNEIQKHLDLVKTILEKVDSKIAKENCSPTAIKIIFYGESGTGKTTTAYYLAKVTNKEILEINNKAFDGIDLNYNYQILNEIFTFYKTVNKDLENLPILFFDNIDVIFHKIPEIKAFGHLKHIRFLNNFIKLLDNFRGIFIATTEKLESLPESLKNRFNIKIQLQFPDENTRKNMLAKLLPAIEEIEINRIAKYPLTYFQLKNLSRLFHLLKTAYPDFVLNKIFDIIK